MFTSYIRVTASAERTQSHSCKRTLSEMGIPPLCILSDSSFYTFQRNSKGEDLWRFFHQRLPHQFPNCKFIFPFSFILAALDCLIKNENLFDPTNWEVVRLPECCELFFRSRFLHISELEGELRQCLLLVQQNPPKEPQIIKASWTVDSRPLPFLQRLLASNSILNAEGEYYISSELTRFFHGKYFSRNYLSRKLLTGLRIAALFRRHLDCEERILYPQNNSIIFCEDNPLFILCRAKTLHISQLDGLLASHCNTEMIFPSSFCEHCHRVL